MRLPPSRFTRGQHVTRLRHPAISSPGCTSQHTRLFRENPGVIALLDPGSGISIHFHLISAEGLLNQNTDAFNITLVLFQSDLSSLSPGAALKFCPGSQTDIADWNL